MQSPKDLWVNSILASKRDLGGFLKLGVPFGGSQNKDYSIWGSISGSPCFGKLPFLMMEVGG